MKVLVFLASGFFFNESLGLFGLRHIVRQFCAVFFSMNLKRFGDQHWFFNENLGVFASNIL